MRPVRELVWAVRYWEEQCELLTKQQREAETAQVHPALLDALYRRGRLAAQALKVAHETLHASRAEMMEARP